MNLDLNILVYLNAFAAENQTFFKLLSLIGDNALLRGLPTFIGLSIVVQSKQSFEKSAKLFLGFFGLFLGIMLSVYCQKHLSINLRPVFDSAIPVIDLMHWQELKLLFEARVYSFPSDTATLYFGINAIIYLQNKRIGLLCFFWNMFVVALYRISMGFHYPSDILGGFLLGLVSVYSLSQFTFANRKIEQLLEKHHGFYMLLNTLCFLFCLESYGLFTGAQSLLTFSLNK
jgi:membrane-associated phospholipid phosphatase